MDTSTERLPAPAFAAWLHREGADRYHDAHSFHARMHAGALRREELARWVANSDMAGDYRNWEQIRAWADGIADTLLPAGPAETASGEPST